MCGGVNTMNMNAIDRAIAGSTAGPLTAHQRQWLMGHLVAPAWKARTAAGLTRESLEDWRHEENFKACHKTHLRTATQADWSLLCGHYLRMLGRTGEARATETRGACGSHAVARHKLREAIAEAAPALGNAAGYAAAIARRQYGTADVTALSARQCWSLVYTLRNRSKAKARKR